jgi:UDP-2,4-diacetamido-2,4,6-trideoxy-beta-L-altropyranose hydrolase
MPFVLFRCDGGPEIGMGHIMRCRALDFAFDERGWERGFAVSRTTAAWVKDLNPIVVPNGLEGVEAVNNIIQDRKADCIVIDHYGLGADFEKQFMREGTLVVALDDLPNRPHHCDVLVDANPGRVESDYLDWLHDRRRTVLFLRSRYALLRPEFWRARERGFRGLRRKPRKLLIALGAADPNNLSAQLVEAATAFRAIGLSVTLIVGQTNPRLEDLKHRCKAHDVRLLCNPPDLVAVMGGADIAISGAGTTCYEFACLGVPMVALIMVDNQRDVGYAVESIGAASVIDCRAGLDLQRVIDEVSAIASDLVLRERISAAAQAMISGDGARRLVDDLVQELANMKRKQWSRIHVS